MHDLQRCFVAIPLASSVAEPIVCLQQELKRRGDANSVKWVDRSALHLTLVFLGELPPQAVASLRQQLAPIAGTLDCFDIKLEGLIGFPNSVQPRVVGIAADGGETLRSLHAQIEQVALSAGCSADQKGFVPHVTLGRLRAETEQARTTLGRGLRHTPIPAWPLWQVETFELLRSVIGPIGPEYSCIERYSLSAR